MSIGLSSPARRVPLPMSWVFHLEKPTLRMLLGRGKVRMGPRWVAGGESIVRSYQEFLFWRFFFKSFPELDEISRRKYFFRFLLISVGLKIRYVWTSGLDW